MLVAVAVLFSLFTFMASAWAHDSTSHAELSPEIRNWINGLKDAGGTSCCSTADGYQPEEVDWDADAKGYRVRWKGEWFRVPDSAVIKEPNRLGYPVVWIGHSDGKPFVRCFLPGGGA